MACRLGPCQPCLPDHERIRSFDRVKPAVTFGHWNKSPLWLTPLEPNAITPHKKGYSTGPIRAADMLAQEIAFPPRSRWNRQPHQYPETPARAVLRRPLRQQPRGLPTFRNLMSKVDTSQKPKTPEKTKESPR